MAMNWAPLGIIAGSMAGRKQPFTPTGIQQQRSGMRQSTGGMDGMGRMLQGDQQYGRPFGGGFQPRRGGAMTDEDSNSSNPNYSALIRALGGLGGGMGF